MRKNHLAAPALCLIACCAQAADQKSNELFNQTKGDTLLAKVVVDSAPGTVSAMSILGTSGDQTAIVQNPRNLTLALKAIDGKSAFGLAITPARTSLMPTTIAAYNKNPAVRLWAATTFSYAQGSAEVNGQSFDRRAFAVETSHFFSPERDDPLVMYWEMLRQGGADFDASKTSNNPCILLGPEEHDANASSDLIEDEKLSDKYAKSAETCRAVAAKKARWNVSRAWASWATGHYQHADGGDSRSLGQTAVVGISWGLGDSKTPTAALITIAGKHTSNAPTLQTFGDASPVLKSSDLVTLRVAIGSEKLRLLLEGSNVRNSVPTATDRTYKSAIGLDLRIDEGIWLNVRAGRQRRIDGSGDENGSSVTLSYSPKALLAL